MRLAEFSPDTLGGSFTQDLIESKTWLITKVSRIHNKFNVIYILGSWYGNLSLLLINQHMQFKKIINVDIDRDALHTGYALAKKLHMADRIEPMVQDANELDYSQAVAPSLVVNTSCNDMSNQGWFDNIPSGTLVALQTRDDDLDKYQLARTLYSGQRKLQDPEASYVRVMKIGVK